MIRALFALISVFSISCASIAADLQLEKGGEAIKSLTGCYLVDYSYSESESLKAGYVIDERVYDVNQNRSVKEWIYAEDLSPTKIRLQHILFATELTGQIIADTFLKHQAEDWEYNTAFLYDFAAPLTWNVKDLTASPNLWTRKITNLDDGLRYQCASAWDLNTKYPEWKCDNYAPIPGRETRDMGRKDYNTMQRSTRVIAYKNSWLERQNNIKTIDANGVRTPLARELGKNWYVRLPDSECTEAVAFAEPKKEFWALLRGTWDEYLIGDRPFIEKPLAPGMLPRFMMMMDVEAKYSSLDLKDKNVSAQAQSEIRKVIEDYRSN
jgi:hypothetical protein